MLRACVLRAPSPEATTVDEALCRRVGHCPAAAVVGGGGGAVGKEALLEWPARTAAEEAAEVVALPVREGKEGREEFGRCALIDALLLASRRSRSATHC